MDTTRTLRTPLTGTALKRLACVSMLIDHIGASCLETGVLTNASRPLPSYSLYQQVYLLDRVLRLIGRLAFPIYCFLLVEGFLHTRSVRKYCARLLGFALLSELAFDWAFFNTPFYPDYQNVYWTLLLGMLAMVLLQRFANGRLSGALLQIGSAAACMLAAELLRTDYGATGVLLIVLLYELRASRLKQCIAGAFLTAYELTGPLAFFPIFFYNGERGRCSRRQSLFYYSFYPVHLFLLACVTNLWLRG